MKKIKDGDRQAEVDLGWKCREEERERERGRRGGTSRIDMPLSPVEPEFFFFASEW